MWQAMKFEANNRDGMKSVNKSGGSYVYLMESTAPVQKAEKECDVLHISNKLNTGLKYAIALPRITATFQFKRFESGSSIALCNSKPNIRVEKGILGYHQSTVLIIKSTNTYRCSVHVTIEGCESTQGQLFTLKPSVEFITDYWCANNSTGVVAITWNKGSSKVTKDVAKNILPHIQQLENLIASTYSDSVAVFDFATVLSVLEKLNPVGVLTTLYDYFHLNWTKIGTALFSMILMYRAILTFDLPLMIISSFIMFVSLATNILACNSYIERASPSIFETVKLYITYAASDAYNLIGFRSEMVEDVIVNTTFKIIEQARETVAIVKPKTALSVVKSVDWCTWLFSIIMANGAYGHLYAVVLVIVYKVAVRILCLVNLDRTKQDVLIVIPGLPWVGQLIYRSLSYNRTAIFVAKRRLNLKEAMLEMSAPVNCANSTISFDIKELTEGNNKLENASVFKAGEYWYTAAHALSETDQQRARVRHDVASNDELLIVGSTDIEIEGSELQVGDSGTVIFKGGKTLIFLRRKGSRQVFRQLVTSNIAQPGNSAVMQTTTEVQSQCPCGDGECFSMSCSKFQYHKETRTIECFKNSEYIDPFDRPYEVVKNDGKIALKNMDLQATHTNLHNTLHIDGLDLKCNNSINWYKGNLESWCLYTFEYKTNTWFKTVGKYDWLISPDKRCASKCIIVEPGAKQLISGTLLYIKRYWGLGCDKYQPVAVVVGKLGDNRWAASQPGQDYIILNDFNIPNLRLEKDQKGRYHILGHKDNVEININTNEGQVMTYSMTKEDSEEDEGLEEDLKALVTEETEFFNRLKNDPYLDQKVEELGMPLLEKLVRGYKTLENKQKDSVFKLFNRLYDKGVRQCCIKEPVLASKQLNSETIELLQQYLKDYDIKEDKGPHDEDLMLAEEVVLADSDYDDSRDFCAGVAIRLVRNPDERIYIDQGKIIINFNKRLVHIRNFIEKLLEMEIKTLQLDLPPDDMFLQYNKYLLCYSYWLTPGTFILVKTNSSRLSKTFKSFVTDEHKYEGWRDLKMAYPARVKRVEQFKPHAWTNVGQKSVETWTKVHSSISNMEPAPRIAKAEIVPWNTFSNLDDRMYIVQLQTAVFLGTAFGCQGSLISNYHVTKGNGIMWTQGENTMLWDQPSFTDQEYDTVCYGTPEIKFAQVSVGEIGVAVNPILIETYPHHTSRKAFSVSNSFSAVSDSKPNRSPNSSYLCSFSDCSTSSACIVNSRLN
ncbi:hypothetical protein ACJJTC_019393 [Scirpophaga incertulas]